MARTEYRSIHRKPAQSAEIPVFLNLSPAVWASVVIPLHGHGGEFLDNRSVLVKELAARKTLLEDPAWLGIIGHIRENVDPVDGRLVKISREAGPAGGTEIHVLSVCGVKGQEDTVPALPALCIAFHHIHRRVY